MGTLVQPTNFSIRPNVAISPSNSTSSSIPDNRLVIRAGTLSSPSSSHVHSSSCRSDCPYYNPTIVPSYGPVNTTRYRPDNKWQVTVNDAYSKPGLSPISDSSTLRSSNNFANGSSHSGLRTQILSEANITGRSCCTQGKIAKELNSTPIINDQGLNFKIPDWNRKFAGKEYPNRLHEVNLPFVNTTVAEPLPDTRMPGEVILGEGIIGPKSIDPDDVRAAWSRLDITRLGSTRQGGANRYYNNEDLKGFLGSLGLSIKGNKPQLIQTIMNNMPEWKKQEIQLSGLKAPERVDNVDKVKRKKTRVVRV